MCESNINKYVTPQVRPLSKSVKSQDKKINFRNFTLNELKSAYNSKKSKIIKVCLRRFFRKNLFKPIYRPK